MLEFIGLLFSALLPSSDAEAGAEAGPAPASGPAEPEPGSAGTAAEPPEAGAGAEAASGVDGDSPSSLKKESPDPMDSGDRGWPRVRWQSSLEVD